MFPLFYLWKILPQKQQQKITINQTPGRILEVVWLFPVLGPLKKNRDPLLGKSKHNAYINGKPKRIQGVGLQVMEWRGFLVEWLRYGLTGVG